MQNELGTTTKIFFFKKKIKKLCSQKTVESFETITIEIEKSYMSTVSEKGILIKQSTKPKRMINLFAARFCIILIVN